MPRPPRKAPSWLAQQGHADLEKEWNARLALDGLGQPEIRPLTAGSKNSRDGLLMVPLDDRAADSHDWAEEESMATFGRLITIGDHPTARAWAAFRQAIARLPRDYPRQQRDFLVAYDDTGFIEEARRRVDPKLAQTTAVRWLRRFANWRKENGC